MTASSIILLACAVVGTLAFILLVAYVLPVLLKLRDLMADLQSTSSEVRHLAISLQNTNERVLDDLQKIDDILETSRQTVASVSTAVNHVNATVLKHSAGILMLLPALRLGWKLIQKIKGER